MLALEDANINSTDLHPKIEEQQRKVSNELELQKSIDAKKSIVCLTVSAHFGTTTRVFDYITEQQSDAHAHLAYTEPRNLVRATLLPLNWSKSNITG